MAASRFGISGAVTMVAAITMEGGEQGQQRVQDYVPPKRRHCAFPLVTVEHSQLLRQTAREYPSLMFVACSIEVVAASTHVMEDLGVVVTSSGVGGVTLCRCTHGQCHVRSIPNHPCINNDDVIVGEW